MVNIGPIRIRETSRGFIVEIRKRKWWGKYYWVHIIPVSGIDEMPWYYDTYASASEGAAFELKRFIWLNSRQSDA
jgi:hypothetical protein